MHRLGGHQLKKSELENQRDQYDAFMLKANQAFQAAAYWQGLEFAGSALEYVDGMMQHAAKYDSASFSNVSAIEAILKFAPILLDTERLDDLQTLLREQRRIKRNISVIV